MLTINNLTVFYDKKTVLSNLSFEAMPGKIHGIVGYNGAGKTTLLNAIYGVPKRFEAIKMNERVLSRLSVAYLESEQFFYPNISGRDYLNLFKSKNSSFDYESICKMFNVPIDNFVDTYSSGMKKKLAIIAILSLDKDIILMDEPFNGLDLESVYILQMALKKVASAGKIIIVTSHIMESLSSICDTISVLDGGKIVNTYYPGEFSSLQEQMRIKFESKFSPAIESVFK